MDSARIYKRRLKKRPKHVVLGVYLLHRQKKLATHFLLQNYYICFHRPFLSIEILMLFLCLF